MGSSDGHNVCSLRTWGGGKKTTRAWGFSQSAATLEMPLVGERRLCLLGLDAPAATDVAQQLLRAIDKAPTSAQQRTEASCPSRVPQDCLKACQEKIEAALAESLKQASQSQQEYSAAKTAAYPASQPTSTPTDVTDVNL